MDRISWCPARQSVSDCAEQIGFLVLLPNAGESAYVPLSTFAVAHAVARHDARQARHDIPAWYREAADSYRRGPGWPEFEHRTCHARRDGTVCPEASRTQACCCAE